MGVISSSDGLTHERVNEVVNITADGIHRGEAEVKYIQCFRAVSWGFEISFIDDLMDARMDAHHGCFRLVIHELNLDRILYKFFGGELE